MAITFSWRAAAADRASRTNRLQGAEVASKSGDMSLMATDRCNFSSNAFATVPKPPFP
jgi:hypothetical protein